jgi:hypothetical protein
VVHRRLVSRLKTSQRPVLWAVVAAACRAARVAGRRRALWTYRTGYAWQRAGRLDRAGAAFTAVCAMLPWLAYRLPDPPARWDHSAVAFARSLAVVGLRQQREGGLRELWQRRGRVVPVVTRATRRRWERRAATDCAARLHLLYLRHRDTYLPRYFARAGGYPMPRTRLARAWRWYAGDVLVQSLRLLRRNGRYVRTSAGVPRHRQLRELWWLSATLPSMPENYYRYELYRPRNRARAGHFLHGHENSPVLYEMLTADGIATVAPLTDKVAFAERAAACGLPVVPTVAVVEHGQVVVATPTMPPADLFVKPLTGKRGLGVHKWWYDAGADAYRPAGADAYRPAGEAGGEPVAAVRREEFVTRLAEGSAGQALIVQPCLVNHPDLSDLALDAVVTCRIITMTDEQGCAEPVIATFRMAADRGSIVDNMHRGGIAAAVALDSGALGPASDYAITGPATRNRRHPVSGGLIDGRKLPLWEQVREVVCRAHDSFRPRLLVGWDVSIGPDGPVLLEGNERPGVGGLQRLHDVPLGAHRFGELLAHHLTRRFGG